MNAQLVSQTKAASRPSFTQVQTQLLQRACACGQHTVAGGECEACRQKREGLTQQANAVPQIVHNVLGSPSQPLDPATRSFMEPRFNQDFSRVRLHTDEQAVESARAVNALAYTIGHDVVFGAGQYAPGTTEGKKLLAHELTHVVQQGGHNTSPQLKLRVNEPGDSFEQEADRVADTLMAPASELHQRLAVDGASEDVDAEEAPLTQDIEKEMTPNGPINLLRSPILQRKADFVAGTVNAVRNPAEQIVLGGPAGITFPTLNGSQFVGAAAAKAAIQKPDLGGESEVAGVKCWVNTVPTNVGSFVENVLAAGPWNHVTTKANLAARLLLPACVAATGGNVTFTAHGIPSDADVAAANRKHEDQHTVDHKAAFNEVVVPWDTALTAAQSSKRKFAGADVATCEAALYAAMGGTPDDIATNFWNSVASKGSAFHATPAGGPLNVSNPASDATCDTAKVDVQQ